MYLREKTITNVVVYMDGRDEPEDYDLDRQEVEMEIWANFMAELGRLNKIKAIKMFRSEFGVGLRESKAFVDDAMRNH